MNRFLAIWYEHKRVILAIGAALLILTIATWYFINPFLEWLSAFWYRNLRTIAMLIALAVILGVGTYLYMEDRRIRQMLNDLMPERRLTYLLQQWQMRNYQILFGLVIIATLFLSVLPDGRPGHKPLQGTVLAKIAQEIAGGEEVPETSGSIGIEAEEGVSPPVAVYPPTDPSMVLDLFETGVRENSELTLDSMKARHENALIGGYLLRNCNRASDAEVEVLLQAIRHDILNYQQNPAHPEIDAQVLYANIVSAAKGSYEMIYSRADCRSPQLDMLEEQFRAYVTHYEATTTP